MKTLYIDCGMGAAGDMLAAALLELLPDKQAFLTQMNDLGLPGVEISAQRAVKCGITGTHFRVAIQGREEDEHHHAHSGLGQIHSLVEALPIPTMVKLDVLAVYRLIAQAESQVHGVPVEHIHLHEVGALDAVADITAVCLLLHRLDVEQIVASPVHVGSGSVCCAHGVLPVPAPATALLLQGIPSYGGEIAGELCTPTGAALLKHFVQKFGPQPMMAIQAVGYGMGKKDFPRANCLRVLLGDTQQPGEEILELRCNLDDMTGEALGFAQEQLLEAGALDVFTTAIGMKKCRPGILLTVLCRESDREKLVQCLFRHTTTLGIRETLCQRHTLARYVEHVETPWGQVRKKVSTSQGIYREKYEYEDLARLAKEHGVSLQEVPLQK